VFGLAAVLHASATAFQMVKYAGVAYLLFMAWKVLNDNLALKVEKQADNRNHLKVIGHGILASVLNPKLSVFFLAFLPQFVDVRGVNPVSQMIGLGAVFMVMTFLVFVAVGSVAVMVRDKIISQPRVMAWLARVFAISFVALGAKLAFTER
ncbi:MAG: LysE family translocator, partial [Alphaproteobacteria bacterium]